MDLMSLLNATDGVARTEELHAGGVSPHRVAQAVRRGAVQRLRRGWIALPDADPALVYACRHGVILSCVTQAQRLGLWVLEAPAPHVAAPKRGRHINTPGAHVHWATPIVPRSPSALADPVENVLAIVATCQPHDSALAIWDSALNRGLITLPRLKALPFIGRARDLTNECSPYADSGLETILRTRLRWLRVPIYSQTWLFGHRVDFLLGDRLVVQTDGGHHVGAQRSSDNAHDALLALHGYHVIRLTYAQIIHDWPAVQRMIMDAIAHGQHLAE